MKVLKFSKRKFSGLDGNTYVEFTQEIDHGKPLVILASREGVTIKKGILHISDMDELQDFAEIITIAWAEKQKLTPKISKDIPQGLL